MNGGSTCEQTRRRDRLPKWFGYALAVAAQAAVTAAAVFLLPTQPVAGSSAPQIVIVLAIAYFSREGPALTALVAGLVASNWVAGFGSRVPWTVPAGSDQWVSIVVYLLNAGGGTFIISLLRRYAERDARLACQLTAAKELAERRGSELEAVLLSASDAILVVDSGGTVTYLNDAADRLFCGRIYKGQPYAEFVESAMIRETNGNPAALQELAVMKALTGRGPCDKIALVNGESGPDTVLSVHASPIRGPDDTIEGAVAVIRNITHQWEAEKALRQSEERFRTLVELLPLGICEIDTSGRITFVNSAICRMQGRSPDEVLGKAFWEVIGVPSEAERLRTSFARAVAESPPPEPMMVPVLAKDGRCLEMQVEWNYKRDHEGRVAGFTLVVTDATERVKAHKELERDYEREHRIAETLQTSLMRPVPRKIGRFEFEKLYRAAWDEARIGGDFYDVFPLNDDKIGIVIGDVSGKGLKAAVQVASAKYSLRGRAYECHSPAAVMEQVNRTLVQDMESEGFASVFLGILDCRRNALKYANAGHAPVMHWRQSESRAVLLMPTGPVTGIDGGAVFGEVEVGLESGDELMLGTDGLYEVHCGGSYLELDRLLEIYSDLKQQGVCSAVELVNKVVEYCRGDLRDDIAVLRVCMEE